MTVLSFQKRRLRRFRKRLPTHRGMKSKSYIPKRIYTVSKGKGRLYKMRQERVKLFTWKPIDPLQYGRSFRIWRGLGKHPGRWRFKPEVKKKQRAFRYPKGKKSFESPIDFESKAWKAYSKKFSGGHFIRSNYPTMRTGATLKQKGEQWKGWAITSGQVNSKAFLFGRMRWGGSKSTGKKYPSASGRGKFWGPRGTFTPALIWDFRLNRSEFRNYIIKYMKNQGILMSDTHIRDDIHKAMKVARRKFMLKTSRYIDTYVPKDTGTLRRTMKISLYKQPLRALVSRIVMDTGDLQYAKPVNRMSSEVLQHNAFVKKVKSRGWYKNSKLIVNRQNHPGFSVAVGYKNRAQERVSIKQAYKHDPKAQKNWWYLSVMSSRAFAKQAYKDFIEAVQIILTIRIYTSFNKTFRKYIPLNELYEENAIDRENRIVMDQEFVKQTPNGMFRNRRDSINFLPYDMQDDYNQYKHFFDFLVTTRKKKKIAIKIGGKKVYIDGTRPATIREKRFEAKKLLEENPGIAEHFGGWISSFLGAKEAPYYLGTNFQKQHADFKIQEGKEKTENSIEDEDRIKSRRRANLRDRWTSATVKKMIVPTKTEIKKLFKVKFK